MHQETRRITPDPPQTACTRGKVGIWTNFKLFKKDILSAQPARLYRAWMAEMRTPFFHSHLCNDPDLVDLVLKQRPMNFPKSERLRAGLKPLLGESTFISSGETWAHQRRIIDPAFEGGRWFAVGLFVFQVFIAVSQREIRAGWPAPLMGFRASCCGFVADQSATPRRPPHQPNAALCAAANL